MKKFELPMMEVQRFAPEDVFTTSCRTEGLGCDSCYCVAVSCDPYTCNTNYCDGHCGTNTEW